MKTVKEVSTVSGVSIRALHHYDKIGLLKPTKVTQSGYRLYDDAALQRLQSILLYRELEFSLKEIKAILDCPDYSPEEAIEQQINLLKLQREHIDSLIVLAQRIQKEGSFEMSFKNFSKSELNQYKEEAKRRWGSTDAYQEYEEREKQADASADGLMQIFSEFGALKHLSPDSAEPQAKVRELQQFICDNYYTCTKPILASLGQMYVADERFRQNIDDAGGIGTAEFASRCIALYCKDES